MAIDARYLSETGLLPRLDANLVTPLPPKSKPPSTPHLQQVQHARSYEQVGRTHELNANKRELHLIEVKYCEDTRPGHQLEATNKQHKIKAKTVTLHTILLGVGGSTYTPNTLRHLKELGHVPQRAHKTALKLHAQSISI